MTEAIENMDAVTRCSEISRDISERVQEHINIHVRAKLIETPNEIGAIGTLVILDMIEYLTHLDEEQAKQVYNYLLMDIVRYGVGKGHIAPECTCGQCGETSDTIH